MKTISVIMPIHDNDAKYLPYSLKCLEDFKGEIILVYDKPTMESCKQIFFFLNEQFKKGKNNIRIINKTSFKFVHGRPAIDSFISGSLKAKGDIIFWIAPDVYFHKRIFEIQDVPAKFEYIDYPNHLFFAWFSFLSKFSKHYFIEVFPRNFPFEKYDWRNEEKLSFPLIPKIPNYIYYSSLPIFHLRRNTSKMKHLIQGITRRKLKKNFFRVFLHSILFLKPFVIIGYINEMLRE